MRQLYDTFDSSTKQKVRSRLYLGEQKYLRAELSTECHTAKWKKSIFENSMTISNRVLAFPSRASNETSAIRSNSLREKVQPNTVKVKIQRTRRKTAWRSDRGGEILSKGFFLEHGRICFYRERGFFVGNPSLF